MSWRKAPCDMIDAQFILRRIQSGDADGLVQFYNGLSEKSIRTFRPLGERATIDVCSSIVQDNKPHGDAKFDLVALCGTQIVGWGFLWSLNSDHATFGLAVADAYQGKGLGSALMDRVLTVAREGRFKKVSLTVIEDNHLARRMYARRGFVKYGEFVGEDGFPYWRMVLEQQAEEKSCLNSTNSGSESAAHESI